MTSSPLRTARVAYCPGLKPTGRSGSNTKRSRSFENAVRSTSRALMNGLRLSKGSSREEWPPDRRTVSSSRDRRQLACSVEPLAAAQHGERDHDRPPCRERGDLWPERFQPDTLQEYSPYDHEEVAQRDDVGDPLDRH